MTIQDIRRARLAQLIDEQYGGSQAKFVEKTGENQSEISGLLRAKSFGERKARKLEERAGLERGWFDVAIARTPKGTTPVELQETLKQEVSARRHLGLVASGDPEWMALVYATQRELDLLTRFRLSSDIGKSLIETAAESSSKDESGSGATNQL